MARYRRYEWFGTGACDGSLFWGLTWGLPTDTLVDLLHEACELHDPPRTTLRGRVKFFFKVGRPAERAMWAAHKLVPLFIRTVELSERPGNVAYEDSDQIAVFVPSPD